MIETMGSRSGKLFLDVFCQSVFWRFSYGHKGMGEEGEWRKRGRGVSAGVLAVVRAQVVDRDGGYHDI